MPSIEIQNLIFSFPSFRLFEGISASLKGPAVIALLGASGSGKTTLLRLIAGILSPQGGAIVRETGKPNRVAWVPQDAGLFPWLTVEENLAFPATLAWNDPRPSLKERKRRAKATAADLGIGAIAKCFPVSISGGQKQRVAIGRALIAGAETLLMDEPFSALDPLARMDVRRLVRKTTLVKNMITVVATHDLLDAAYIGDQILLISGGNPASLTHTILSANSTFEERIPSLAADIAADLATRMVRGN